MATPRKIRCKVVSIASHGHGVYSVDLAPLSPVPAYRAGQFLHLTVDPYDPAGFWPESRVFSIASSPRDRSRIRICYSVKGRYTAKMEQVLAPEQDVWIKMPYGDFFIEDSASAVLVAGGTGISAFSAFLESLGADNRQEVTLVYGARTPDLFLFNEMILRQFERVPKFDVVYFTENEDDGFARHLSMRTRVPKCVVGRIDLDSLYSPSWRDKDSDEIAGVQPEGSGASSKLLSPEAPTCYYLSGPPAMLKSLSRKLAENGVPNERIRNDAWE